MRVAGDEERIAAKYQKVERMEKDIWALEKDIEKMKESVAVPKVLETASAKTPTTITEDSETRICREAESLKGDAEQERKLAALIQENEQLESEKAEDEKHHAVLKSLYNTVSAEYSLNNRPPNWRDLWCDIYSTATEVDESRRRLCFKSQMLQRINLDIRALKVEIWAAHWAAKRGKELAYFNKCSERRASQEATAVSENLDTVESKESTAITKPSEQVEKLAALLKEKTQLETEKIEDTRRHTELKAVYERGCADYKLEYCHPNDSSSLWRATHSAAIKVDEHVHYMNKKSERLQRIAVDIWALNVETKASWRTSL